MKKLVHASVALSALTCAQAATVQELLALTARHERAHGERPKFIRVSQEVVSIMPFVGGKRVIMVGGVELVVDPRLCGLTMMTRFDESATVLDEEPAT